VLKNAENYEEGEHEEDAADRLTCCGDEGLNEVDRRPSGGDRLDSRSGLWWFGEGRIQRWEEWRAEEEVGQVGGGKAGGASGNLAANLCLCLESRDLFNGLRAIPSRPCVPGSTPVGRQGTHDRAWVAYWEGAWCEGRCTVHSRDKKEQLMEDITRSENKPLWLSGHEHREI
jgi:hypothetical protein